MRAWLFALAVLATFNRVQQVASTEEVKSSSSSLSYTSSSLESSSLDSNNVDLSDSIETDNSRDKPDAQTLVDIEKNLLSLLGFKQRPKVDRKNIVIPEAMIRKYVQLTGHQLDLLAVPKANTIRSYSHEGESAVFLITNRNSY